MKLFRYTIFALSVALIFSVGSSSATIHHPEFSVADDRTLSLRETGSQIVMETIEDAIRQGGLALLGEGFQIDSSLNWVFGETVEGEVDAVVPLWSRGRHVVFAQPGAVFWTGLEEEERIDGNLGVVYRTMSDNGVVSGISLFYDHDFQIGHSRLGIGVDAQSGSFYGAFNYYHPLSDTQDGREGYVEDALQGMDINLAIESNVTRFGSNVGYWKFQGDEDVKDDWNFSYGVDAGFRIIPGIFLEGSLQHHDKDVSLGQRAKVGLAFKFSLPDFKGKSYGDGSGPSDLYKIVEREKRILYEEREANSPVQLTPVDGNGQPLTRASTIEEGSTVTIAGELEALPEPVMLELVIDEDASSADLGTDFSYGHEVYVLDEATGQQSAPGTVTDCPEAMCEMMIPAGVTKFDVEIEILTDSAAKEVPEEVVLRVNVPEEHQRMIRDGETTVTIQAHGNEIGFAADAVTTLAENNERTGVEVSVSVDLPSPTPITLNVATSGTAIVNEDYRINTTALRIPANASSASLTLTGINNDEGEGSKSIVLTLSGNLPEGWAITEDEHEVTLQDDDLSVFFTSATRSEVDEPASDQSVTIEVGITQAPSAEIKVMLAADTSASSAEQGTGKDYTFTDIELTFPVNSTASQTATLMVLHDTVPENDETIVLTLTEVGGSLTAGGNNFSLGGNHTVTIPANDNTVSFASSTSTLTEGDSTMTEVMVNVAEPASEDITLNVAVVGTTDPTAATEGTDYTIDSKSLTIRARQSSGAITLRGRDDDDSEGNETIMLEISLPSGSSLPSGWALGSQTTHTVTLRDNDLVIGFAVPNREVAEPDSGMMTFTVAVELTVSPEEDVTVPIGIDAMVTNAQVSGSNADVTYTPTSLTFAASTTELSKNITFTVNADALAEPDDILRLLISNDASYTAGANDFSVGQESFTLTIPANDNVVQLSPPADTSFEEGESLSFSLASGNPAPSGGVPVAITVTPQGSASAGDISFTANQVIPEGQSSVTFAIAAVDDEESEADEEFEVSIAEGANFPSGWGMVVDTPTTITINENDRPATISFSGGHGSDPTKINDEIDEGVSGSATLTITISPAPTSQISIPLTVTGSHAAYGDSFAVTGGTLTGTPSAGNLMLLVAANTGTVTLTITAAQDGADGANNITVSLGTPLPGDYIAGTASTWEIRIHDDD